MAQMTEAVARDMLKITRNDGSGSHAPLTTWEEAQLLHWWLRSHEILERINMLACYASEENTDTRATALLEIGKLARQESPVDGGDERV